MSDRWEWEDRWRDHDRGWPPPRRRNWHPVAISLAMATAVFAVVVIAEGVAEYVAPTPTPYLCAERAHPDTCSDAPEG